MRKSNQDHQGREPVAGAYGNYVSDDGEAIAHEAYGSNYDRLVALKTLQKQIRPSSFA